MDEWIIIPILYMKKLQWYKNKRRQKEKLVYQATDHTQPICPISPHFPLKGKNVKSRRR